MAQTHNTGAIKGSRNGSEVVQHSGVYTSAANLSGVSQKLITIVASPAQPAYLRLTVFVNLAFVNGANASTLSVGTTSGGTNLLNAVDMKVSPGTNYVTNGPVKVFTTDTDIWVTRTDTATAASAGEVFVMADVAEINVKPPTTPE